MLLGLTLCVYDINGLTEHHTHISIIIGIIMVTHITKHQIHIGLAAANAEAAASQAVSFARRADPLLIPY